MCNVCVCDHLLYCQCQVVVPLQLLGWCYVFFEVCSLLSFSLFQFGHSYAFVLFGCGVLEMLLISSSDAWVVMMNFEIANCLNCVTKFDVKSCFCFICFEILISLNA